MSACPVCTEVDLSYRRGVAATNIPIWVIWGTPVSAFLGGLIGQVVTRRGAKELEKRSRREEVMRTLRWAAELAIDSDPRRARLGVDQLTALGDSDLLDESGQLYVDAALDSVLSDPVDMIEEAGDQAEVLEQWLNEALGRTDDIENDLSSSQEPSEPEGRGDA